MDLEAPVDAWYVWLALALVGIGLLALVGTLPSQPAPDAERAADTIDRVASGEYDASARYRHDASAIRIGPERISMRNDGGTAHATIAYGQVVHVRAIENDTRRERLRVALSERGPIDERTRTFLTAAIETGSVTSPEWYPAQGTVRARAVHVSGERVVLFTA